MLQVIQRRIDGQTDFYRGWSEYEIGFGDLMKVFWIGMWEMLPGVLEQSHSLGCKYYTVKSAYKITSIKQSPVLKDFLVLSQKISDKCNLFQ
jgi:putative component of membrane protein insertase Oxa1/YidC/SpoIIIJ protein YidD